MCRLAGIINKTIDLNSSISRMRDAMRRGGPDDSGVLVSEEHGLALGHRRLSLIDLSTAGHQPMSTPDGRCEIIFNGEIYNYQTLRADLMRLGIAFQSKTDTEVLLKGYAHEGPAFFSKLNGMYAFAIWDKRSGELVLARDHAGIKPLYYSFRGDAFCFASEIRAFRSLDPGWPENEQWKQQFLSFGHLPEPVTTLKDVVPLRKGTCLIVNIATLQHRQFSFYEFSFHPTITNGDEAKQLLREKLEAAVERHLISDAPIGLFLSGGIDSSLLTLLAAPHLGQSLKTLSVVFDEAEFSEAKFQKIISDKAKTHHKSFRVTQELFEEKLGDVLEAMDQPSIDAINTYFISGYAHEYGLTAVLSGIGADELWYGYADFRKQQQLRQLKRLPAFARDLSRFAPQYSLKKLGFLSLAEPIASYLFFRGLYTPRSVAQILDGSEKEVVHALNDLMPSYKTNAEGTELISWIETNFYMQNQLLKDADYMSMWHSLEVRVPFLDKEIMELAALTSADLKFHATQGKHLLIQAFADVLPEEIWNRKKQGFTFPFAQWMLTADGTRPRNRKQQQYFDLFKKGEINWSRYWSVFLLDQFSKAVN